MQLETTPLSAADVPTLDSKIYKHYTYTEALEKDKKKEYSCKIITTRSSCLDSKKHALYNTMSSEQNIARKISTQCSWVDLICFLRSGSNLSANFSVSDQFILQLSMHRLME